jgi:peptide/nickel transport system substrate-binding protein
VKVKKFTKSAVMFLCLLMVFSLIPYDNDGLSSLAYASPSNLSDTGSIGDDKNAATAIKADPTSITIAAYGDPAHMDPQNDGYMVQRFLVKNIFDTLVEMDPVTGELIPALATSWEWVDETHLKMKLREGVKFHNGDSFTADDVLFTIQRFPKSTATSTLYSAFDGENSTSNGDYEVTIAFRQAFVPGLYYLANQRAAILPAKVLRKDNDALRLNPVGTGAFSFVSWTQGSEMYLKRNDNWWGKAPYFEKAHIYFSQDASARSITTESGNADIGVALDPTVWQRVYDGKVAHMLASTAACPQTGTLVFNYVNNKALNDINVRRAIAHAVEWEKAIEASAGSLGFLGESIFAPTILGYKPQGTYQYDPQLAKKYLADAGYAKGLNFTCFTNKYYVAVQLMEIVQAYLAEIGITMTITNGDTPTWFEQLRTGGVDVSLTAFEASSYDPSEIMNQTTVDGGYIVGAIQDKHYNDLISQALYETDSVKRIELYGEVQKYVYDNVFTIPMYVTNTSYVYWDYLDGFIPDPVQGVDLRIISLK